MSGGTNLFENGQQKATRELHCPRACCCSECDSQHPGDASRSTDAWAQHLLFCGVCSKGTCKLHVDIIHQFAKCSAFPTFWSLQQGVHHWFGFFIYVCLPEGFLKAHSYVCSGIMTCFYELLLVSAECTPT